MKMLLAKEDSPLNHVVDTVLLRVNGMPVLTMHMVTLIVVAALFVLVMMRAARSIATGPESMGNERYLTRSRLGQIIESLILYLRAEMLVPVLGEEHTRRYLPFLMTSFFFILFQNLFGLIPVADAFHLVFGHHSLPLLGGTATANIAVTATLAVVSFIVIQIHAIRELGIKGFLMHLCGGLIPGPLYLLPVVAIVFVVEFAGLFIKPAALAIRLFANMVAGHTLTAVLLSFGASAAKAGMSPAGWGSISVLTGVAAVAISFLELFVAFLQAFIFMFLTAVFISLMSHHEEHEHEEHAQHHHEPGHGAEPVHA